MSSIVEPLTKKLTEKMETLPKIGVKDIWKLRYKEGPIMREICFKFIATGDRKADRQNAYTLAQRYVTFLAKQDNKKVVMIGVPEPFAMDIEEFLNGFSDVAS